MTEAGALGASPPGRPMALLVGAGIAALTAAVGVAILSVPPGAPDLAGVVRDHLPESGVSNPVTAVLLNFRAYDTLLEVGVLVVALMAAWALGPPARHRFARSGPVLTAAMAWLGPAMVLVAGYLLWRGAAAPGGAFQAGSVLAALLVVCLVAGLTRAVDRWPIRVALSLGLALFTGVGVALMIAGDGFLTYPEGAAKELILLIEAGATVSIGTILAALFLGGRPADADEA